MLGGVEWLSLSVSSDKAAHRSTPTSAVNMAVILRFLGRDLHEKECKHGDHASAEKEKGKAIPNPHLARFTEKNKSSLTYRTFANTSPRTKFCVFKSTQETFLPKQNFLVDHSTLIQSLISRFQE